MSQPNVNYEPWQLDAIDRAEDLLADALMLFTFTAAICSWLGIVLWAVKQAYQL